MLRTVFYFFFKMAKSVTYFLGVALAGSSLVPSALAEAASLSNTVDHMQCRAEHYQSGEFEQDGHKIMASLWPQCAEAGQYGGVVFD